MTDWEEAFRAADSLEKTRWLWGVAQDREEVGAATVGLMRATYTRAQLLEAVSAPLGAGQPEGVVADGFDPGGPESGSSGVSEAFPGADFTDDDIGGTG